MAPSALELNPLKKCIIRGKMRKKEYKWGKCITQAFSQNEKQPSLLNYLKQYWLFQIPCFASVCVFQRPDLYCSEDP